MGRTITTANNTRVLDARKRTQFILETVDNYLQQNGLINKTDIRYFSHLNDILFVAFNSPRLSGTKKFIRFTPGIAGYGTNLTQNSNINKYERKLNNKSLALATGIKITMVLLSGYLIIFLILVTVILLPVLLPAIQMETPILSKLLSIYFMSMQFIQIQEQASTLSCKHLAATRILTSKQTFIVP